jgi:integrase
MARASKTEHVKKICGCAKWRDCAHPWYLDVQKDKRRHRRNLDVLIGRHAGSFADATTEARRAIVAWESGRDARDLLPVDRPTLAQLLEQYGKRPDAAKHEDHQIAAVARVVVTGPDGPRPFGEWRAETITRPAVEQFRAVRLAAGRRAAGINRNLALLRACFNWAVLNGYVPETPFKVGNVAAIKLQREEKRTRRLQPGEEARLLAAVEHDALNAIIMAALDTGMRRGELLSLQWWQVGDALLLPATKTKAHADRRVPISTRLRGVLDARRNDPAGEPLPPAAYVFGDELGRRRRSLHTVWRSTRTRAGLTDLRFHDLRREAGSRWMDNGVSLATIQRWLGHANISQTSTYLSASIGNDEAEMRAFEARTGRANPLTPIDVFAGSNGLQGDQSSSGPTENAQQSAVVH